MIEHESRMQFQLRYSKEWLLEEAERCFSPMERVLHVAYSRFVQNAATKDLLALSFRYRGKE